MQKDRQFKANYRLASQIIASNKQYQHFSEAQRKRILEKRIQKFYKSQTIDVAVQHFEKRIEPIYQEGVKTCDNALIVFGVDFLTIADVKDLFSPKEGSFSYTFINKSNVLLKYSSPTSAREVIIKNLNNDSRTKVKIQEEDAIPEHTRPAKLPKEWIELNPYIYRFFYKGQQTNPDRSENYSRKLLVRYATINETMLTKASINHIQELYQRCKEIWMIQAEKHAILKKIIHEKLEQFKKKKDEMTNNYNKMMNQRGAQQQRQRSRDKEKEKSYKKTLEKSILIGNQDDIDSEIQRDKLSQREENLSNIAVEEEQENSGRRKRSERIGTSSVSSDLEGLIKNIQDINLNVEEMLSSQRDSNQFMREEGEDLEAILHNIQNLNFDHLRAEFIQLPYQTAIPFEMRVEKDPNSKFEYEKYLSKTDQMEKRLKKYGQIDLTHY